MPKAAPHRPAKEPPADRGINVTFRFPTALLAHVDAQATADRRSRTNMCEVLIAEALKARGVDLAAEPVVA